MRYTVLICFLFFFLCADSAINWTGWKTTGIRRNQLASVSATDLDKQPRYRYPELCRDVELYDNGTRLRVNVDFGGTVLVRFFGKQGMMMLTPDRQTVEPVKSVSG